jgi:hypothetical protein
MKLPLESSALRLSHRRGLFLVMVEVALTINKRVSFLARFTFNIASPKANDIIYS